MTNYIISYTNGLLAVNPSPLTVTANGQSKIYGQTVVFGSGSAQYSHSAMANGETMGTVTLAVSGNGGAATAAVAGSPYTITPSAAAGGTFAPNNYAITYVAGSLDCQQGGVDGDGERPDENLWAIIDVHGGRSSRRPAW